MSEFEFPGATFRAYPQIAATTPEGWSETIVAGTVAAVISDRGEEAFSPNVVVTVSRFPAPIDLADSEPAIDEYVATLVEVQPIERRVVAVGDREWSIVEFAHMHPEAGTLLQLIAITAVAAGGAVDVVRFTGTCSGDNFEVDFAAIRQVVLTSTVRAS